jgi:hypothetical protein
MSFGSVEIRNQGSWTKEINNLVEHNRSTIEFQLEKTQDFRSYVGSYSS